MQAEIAQLAQKFQKIVHAFFNSKNEERRKAADQALRQVCSAQKSITIASCTSQ